MNTEISIISILHFFHSFDHLGTLILYIPGLLSNWPLNNNYTTVLIGPVHASWHGSHGQPLGLRKTYNIHNAYTPQTHITYIYISLFKNEHTNIFNISLIIVSSEIIFRWHATCVYIFMKILLLLLCECVLRLHMLDGLWLSLADWKLELFSPTRV